jgi:adenosylcobinamide-GDP ribazoletransferase
MKDSRTGAMGVIALLAVLLVKFAALASLASLGAAELWPAAALMPLAGRCAMLVHMAIMPAARPGGLGAVFCGRPRAWAIALWAAAILAVAGWLVADLPGLVAWVASAAVTLLTAAYFYRKIGGATGDTLGAVCEIVETVPAISLALWPAHATLLAH